MTLALLLWKQKREPKVWILKIFPMLWINWNPWRWKTAIFPPLCLGQLALLPATQKGQLDIWPLISCRSICNKIIITNCMNYFSDLGHTFTALFIFSSVRTILIIKNYQSSICGQCPCLSCDGHFFYHWRDHGQIFVSLKDLADIVFSYSGEFSALCLVLAYDITQIILKYGFWCLSPPRQPTVLWFSPKFYLYIYCHAHLLSES